ncbi:hypothetical protein C1J03_07020 [Sulfitobacter sp. SK012]|nr:hypothetical protein C1J03_07020 [Sulfitobacter sp. SK012]
MHQILDRDILIGLVRIKKIDVFEPQPGLRTFGFTGLVSPSSYRFHAFHVQMCKVRHLPQTAQTKLSKIPQSLRRSFRIAAIRS